ncbi:MAG TPA: dTMP kinase [Woeseiaceae bacterium]|nr:dTMP kinase [Woeseiaceae bacterium]
MTERGRFVTIEGGEGVGKSTNLEFLRALIERRGFKVLTTREPGGTPGAERIRDLLLEHGDEVMPDIAELLLFFAARALQVENVIRPALARGTWVVCDRFTDTTRAYQGSARGLDRDLIERLAEQVHPGIEPDLTLLLDAPADVGQGRARQRGGADRLEAERAAFHQRVRDAYLAQARQEPQRIELIDATQPLARVQAEIERAVERLWQQD